MNTFFDFNTAMPQQRPERNIWHTDPDASESFRSAMAENGFSFDGPIDGSGRIVRFQVANDKGREQTGWYVFYADGVAAGAYGDWRSGDKLEWCSKASFEMSAAEVEVNRLRVESARAARETQKKEDTEKAHAKMAQLWEVSGPCNDHEYLQKKGVRSFGLLKVARDGKLLIPAYGPDGSLWSLQRVDSEGKRFFQDLPTKGLSLTIQGNTAGPVIVCEGYATGASIHEATGSTVVCAFNAGNLMAVAKQVRAQHPQGKIVIAADNDIFTTKIDGTPHNVGRIKGEEAAHAVGAQVIFPEFDPDHYFLKPTDFNDLAAIAGIDAVRKAVTQMSPEAAVWLNNILNSSIAAFDTGPLEERKWLIADTIPLGVPVMFSAMGDAGKGMLMLDLGLKVAAKRPAVQDFFSQSISLGHTVAASGHVVYLTAEDERDEIRRRLDGIDPENTRFENRAAHRFHVMCMPDLGGVHPFFKHESGETVTTKHYALFREALSKIDNIALIIIDPLASFVAADVNTDPSAGAFVTGSVAALAKETGATVILVHHMNKGNKEGINSPVEARAAIRGTTAIVDGVRLAYCLWEETSNNYEKGKEICESLGERWEPGRVFRGAVVKSNGPADRGVKTFVRNMENGLLENHTEQITTRRIEKKAAKEHDKDLLKQVLLADIKYQAEQGHAIKQNDLFIPSSFAKVQPILSPPLCDEVSPEIIREIVTEMIANQEILLSNGGSSTPQYLDVDGGPYASYAEGSTDEKPNLKGGHRTRRTV